MLRSVAKGLIHFYRRYISPISPGKCRYYPTCSEYALLQFEKRPIWIAFPMSLLRILRCNQLFPGGFDYPQMHFSFKTAPLAPRKEKPNTTSFYLVPSKPGWVYIIRSLKESRQCP